MGFDLRRLRRSPSLGDFGSSIGYASSLANLAGYPLAQATSLFNQLNRMFANDVASGVITDKPGLQDAFNAASLQIQQNAQNDSANQAAWNAIATGLTSNARALDNDAGYQGSQGNFASTTAGAAADAAQGGDANSGAGALNVVAGGPGGSSVIDPSKIPQALFQALGPGGALSAWWDALGPGARWGIEGVVVGAGLWLANKVRRLVA